MNLLNYIIRRLLYAVFVLIGATLFIFLIFNVIGGDPTAVLLGKYATAQEMATLKHELGLDRPFLIQYLDILKSAFTFDFGQSWSTKQPIGEMLKRGAMVSLTICFPAFVVGHVLAISTSLLMAKFRGMLGDKILVIFCVIMTSISILLYIIAGQFFLAYKWDFFELTGYEEGFPDCFPYILLPNVILIVLHFCYELRFYRTMVLDEIYQDYVRTARAKGLSTYKVLFKHVLKNIMIPIITIIVRDLPVMLFGSVLIENFFSIPGLGNAAIHAMHCSDFPTMKAITILSAVVSILFSMLGDLLYTLVDPRIKI